MFFSKQTFRYSFLFIFLTEIISFLGYLYPVINKLSFASIVLITIFICLYKFEYGLLILLAELFIGSKGYLFYFEQGGLIISIRIALWLVIISVWLAKFIFESVKNKKIDFSFLNNYSSLYFLIVGFFIFWSVGRALLIGNNFNNIFFDANGWIYFSLIFPIFYIFNKSQSLNLPEENKFKKSVLALFFASISWLCLETYFLLFAYSHNLVGITYDLYRWVRNSGVGEITFIQGGFYRIFFQSHIYVLIGSLACLTLLLLNKNNNTFLKNQKLFKIKNYLKSQNFLIIIFLSVLTSINLLTMSRSNWLGLAGGLIFLFLWFIWRKNLQSAVKLTLYFFISLIIGFIFIVAIVKFPYPNPLGGFSASDLLTKRAGQITGEAGVSSRRALLPELWKKIKISPFLGQGFGSTVTYESSDPRILESNPSGKYTTYSFEWGILDIWLKLGIFGLLSYLLLLYIIISKYLKKIKLINFFSMIDLGLIAGVFAIFIVSIFSPYLNHPLGIGYIILISALTGKT